MLKKYFAKLKNNGALCHNMTNYVTVNDCANITIAIGASPIMADEIKEVEDIQTICSGLNINIGTLNERVIESMIVAGKTANKLNHPVLLDPVGFAASKFRTASSLKLIDNIQFSVIKGNISEIKSLATDSKSSFGVDACDDDKVTSENLKEVIEFAKSLSKSTGSVIVITGEIDLIANETSAFIVRNGDPMMSSITGSGCMLSSLITAFICANPDSIFEAATTAVVCMGIAGEIAAEKVRSNNLGFSSFRTNLIDEISKLNESDIEERGRYEKY
jgi:hydroxyethylthiazole kinase